jgi:hypothetical protein
MNNYNNHRNGSRNMAPLMVMPSGQVLFHEQPEPREAARYQVPSENGHVQTLSWQRAGLVLLALALTVPAVLLLTQVVVF